jgi:hypothetical protein
MRSITNPDNGAPIDDIINGNKYSLIVGQTLVFRDDVAQTLLDKYGFLAENVALTDQNGDFKCPYCEYNNKYKVAIFAHAKQQHKDKELISENVKRSSSAATGEVAKGTPIEAPGDRIARLKRERFAEVRRLEEGTLDEDEEDRESLTGPGVQEDKSVI